MESIIASIFVVLASGGPYGPALIERCAALGECGFASPTASGSSVMPEAPVYECDLPAALPCELGD